MVTVQRSRPKSASPFVGEVFVRLTAEQLQRLDEVQAMEPALPNHVAAVRRLIDALGDDDLTGPDAAAGKEGLAEENVAEIVSAMDERTRAYSELIKQVRAIGVNINQLTRLAHQMRLGADGRIPTDAFAGLSRGLDGVLDRASVLAHQDAYVESVVAACLPR